MNPDRATLSVVTMDADSVPPAPPVHECGYLCDCPANKATIAAAMARGVRPIAPLPVKRAA